MANYNFTPDAGTTNQFGIHDSTRQRVGTLRKRKRNWDLDWEGTQSTHPTKLSVRQHLRVLGHTCNGL